MKLTRKQKSFLTGHNCLNTVRRFFPQVERVEDGTRVGVVEVTAEDNAHAAVKNHRTCAMAIASKRCFHADGAIIGLTTSFIIYGKVAYRYLNPQTVSREITSFDRKAGFDAGTYHLSPPPDSQRLGAERATKPDRPSGAKSKTPTGKYRHFTKGVRTTLGNIGVS